MPKKPFRQTKITAATAPQYTEPVADGPVPEQVETEDETAYLLKSPAMRARLLAARESQHDVPLEEILQRLGLGPEQQVLSQDH